MREVDLERAFAVTAVDADGTVREWQARFVVDATGRDTLLGNRLKTAQIRTQQRRAGHFRNAHREGVSSRATSSTGSTMAGSNYPWLKDGVTSVGAVRRIVMKSRDKPVP